MARKQCIVESANWSGEELFANQRPIVLPVLTNEDAKEGPRAFAGKRAPNWQGK